LAARFGDEVRGIASQAVLLPMNLLLSTPRHRASGGVPVLLPWIARILACAFLAMSSAQVLAQDVKERTKLSLTVEATAGVNPDASLRPSPIKVRIYELKDAATFAQADYFGLDTSDKVVLATDMLARDEFILRPGEKRRIERKSNAQTMAIGVLAGYLRLTPQGGGSGKDLPALVEIVRSFIGFEYLWEVELLIGGVAAPQCRLGDTTQLGWSTWMAGARASRGSVTGMLFEPESYGV
jgi:type VI secretion system VasD/TssJ family lipoprotein